VVSKSVLTAAPLRVSFLGGGTDFSSYYRRQNGAVLAAAIDKYVYVHVKRHDPLFQERYRVSYSEVEHCQQREEIKNGIVRASLELLNMDTPLQISTSADLPANSGLGSSSSFAVALLLALHSLKGETVAPAQLAEEACEVEIGILGSPIGKQDQYAAAFGGVNVFEFFADESVKIQPISARNEVILDVFSNSTLIWTQQARLASAVLEDQETRSERNQSALNELRQLVYLLKDDILSNRSNLRKFGKYVTRGWEIKKSLSPLIAVPAVDQILSDLQQFNTCGSKLLGAGAGGFVFTIHENLLADLESLRSRWPIFCPGIDNTGARILSES
jgi:D-glycero-alpha-D-manno-heptose-7-phosphate kinase